MAGDPDKLSAGLTPPQFARRILAIATDPADRSYLIGDLHEEYARLHRISPARARNWYWRQARVSLPHLFAKRLRSIECRRFGAAFLAIAAAVVLVNIWDVVVARNAARGAATITGANTYNLARAVYLAVQMIGMGVAGATIAAISFRNDKKFAHNIAWRLAPAAAALFGPMMVAMVMSTDSYPVAFRLLWIGLSAPALLAGAWCATWFRGRR